jgi:carbonic anhydrase
MSSARKIVACAGLGLVAAAAWSMLAVPARASAPQPTHAHPGQNAPRGGPSRAPAPPTTTPAARSTVTADPATAEAAAPLDELLPTYSGSTPDAATVLSILSDGNARWVSGHTQSPNTDEGARRDAADHGQHPFATILTCADSRLPVERIFDRGVGELFVARVAGNVVDSNEAGTIEYAVEHLGTPVVVIMGHTGCGAVKAAVDGAGGHGNVRLVIGQIEPAVRRAATVHPSADGEELVNLSVRENVMQSMFDLLATSDAVRSAVDNGRIQLVGAVYDLRSGEVEWLGSHPWEEGLISVMQQRQQPGLGAATRDHATAEVTGGRDDR